LLFYFLQTLIKRILHFLMRFLLRRVLFVFKQRRGKYCFLNGLLRGLIVPKFRLVIRIHIILALIILIMIIILKHASLIIIIISCSSLFVQQANARIIFQALQIWIWKLIFYLHILRTILIFWSIVLKLKKKLLLHAVVFSQLFFNFHFNFFFFHNFFI